MRSVGDDAVHGFCSIRHTPADVCDHCICNTERFIIPLLRKENIRQIPFLTLVRSCKNAFEAMQVLQEETVDLMFLDIQMPGMLGTKFLAGLRNKPLVIFVTAYSDYAVESYDLEVLDYLMKPVSLERFTRAAYKALEASRKKESQPINEQVTPKEGAKDPGSFFVNVEYALVRIDIQSITHIEGMKDYVKIFLDTAAKPILTKSTLKGIEARLPTEQFMRVHKSYIVNLDKIESIRSHQIYIRNFEIPVSDSNIEDLLNRLGHPR
jgi:DNA-binding LytR/AlgR family response regulator